MASYPTPDIVTALAPDAASLKAGRGLASPGKWTLAAGNGEVLWGLMQGSGKDPYQVQALADGSATKCSCPSRKFPCKHALGILFIAAEQPAKLATSPPPAWVEEWLASRAEKATKAEAKAAAAAEGPKAPVDEKAQAKRREKRAGRVAEGVAFLQQWLSDLVRQGLADAPLNGYNFWEDPARRMVDAQAPGLARQLRQCALAAGRSPQDQGPLMDQLGRLHLLLTVSHNKSNQDLAPQEEVDQLLGYTVPQETVLAGPEVSDQWFIAARTMEEEDRVITALTWLWGAQSRRWAVWIQSAPAQQPVFTPMPLGRWVSGGLAFYPGIAPLRALWKTPHTVVESNAPLQTETVDAFLARYAALLAENPWRTQIPFCLRAVTVKESSQDWWVDESGTALPLATPAALTNLMMAVDGGQAVPVCGLWNGRRAVPLAMADGSAWMSLTGNSTP